MTAASGPARLAVDIGGTFTDVVLESNGRQVTVKVLTTPDNPEQGVLDGVAKAMAEAGAQAAEVGLIIHGTTLATNALIERKGAKTALIVTEGLRDSVEMAYENRFEQYDINIDRPDPLVPRYLRWPVTERLNAAGELLRPLDEASVAALAPKLAEHGIESLAIGLIHSYANPAHERRVAARGLDLRHLGAVVGEQHRGHRARGNSACISIQPDGCRLIGPNTPAECDVFDRPG